MAEGNATAVLLSEAAELFESIAVSKLSAIAFISLGRETTLGGMQDSTALFEHEWSDFEEAPL